MNIKYIAVAVEWFDRVNGNSYHSVRMTRISDNAIIKSQPLVLGYGDKYRETAIVLMAENGWIDGRYKKEPYQFESDANYPIFWSMTRNARKKDIINNVS